MVRPGTYFPQPYGRSTGSVAVNIIRDYTIWRLCRDYEFDPFPHFFPFSTSKTASALSSGLGRDGEHSRLVPSAFAGLHLNS